MDNLSNFGKRACGECVNRDQIKQQVRVTSILTTEIEEQQNNEEVILLKRNFTFFLYLRIIPRSLSFPKYPSRCLILKFSCLVRITYKNEVKLFISIVYRVVKSVRTGW